MLARTLGATVGELQARMGYSEFVEWQTVHKNEPWGEARADLRMATLATITANMNRDTKRRARPYQVSDFLFRFWTQRPTRPDDWQALYHKTRRIFEALGAQTKH